MCVIKEITNTKTNTLNIISKKMDEYFLLLNFFKQYIHVYNRGYITVLFI